MQYNEAPSSLSGVTHETTNVDNIGARVPLCSAEKARSHGLTARSIQLEALPRCSHAHEQLV